MRVTSKGQVTIPKPVRDALGIGTDGTEVEFVSNEAGEWVSREVGATGVRSRFRTAHEVGRSTMSTDEILALTRG